METRYSILSTLRLFGRNPGRCPILNDETPWVYVAFGGLYWSWRVDWLVGGPFQTEAEAMADAVAFLKTCPPPEPEDANEGLPDFAR